ncbi:pirin family protein [Alkalimarinus alittae]|uniref:Pirin family protein n=1 Tax=Alkalimarinus alittae TaxID=2961619 RepID=A0ABY6N6P4_9ALTE|nr:pirin family protein [Alkalimarinus alittae]UZE97695.1 pirin family protein [Alkalimarinus alittae]
MAYLLSTKQKDLDGFCVRRILPNAKKRMIGPFIFIDHMGPADFSAGEGIDVRPHPHIGLSTITYLMEGSLLHRDSLGNNLEILPGDVNWMTAGKGIVHSERETIEVKAGKHKLDGMQCWMALPKEMAEITPSFTHIKCACLPHYMHDGVLKRLIAGEAHG